MSSPIGAEEITELVGDVDPFVIERIIEMRATVDEVAEALAEIEVELIEGDERPFDAPRPSPRVMTIRALLAPLFLDDEAGAFSARPA